MYDTYSFLSLTTEDEKTMDEMANKARALIAHLKYNKKPKWNGTVVIGVSNLDHSKGGKLVKADTGKRGRKPKVLQKPFYFPNAEDTWFYCKPHLHVLVDATSYTSIAKEIKAYWQDRESIKFRDKLRFWESDCKGVDISVRQEYMADQCQHEYKAVL